MMQGGAELQRVRSALQQIWGYEDFRPPQGEIVQALLQGKDSLIIMPTGGGKSICFQLPALLQSGLTIVISPLVALMENQVQELRDLKLPAGLLHSQLPGWERKKTLSALEKQQLRLLYVSPETLLSPVLWKVLTQPQLTINGLILDEAHCLVQWGETFRPVYRRLGAVRPALLQGKPSGSKMGIAAFTATADPSSQQIIQQVLGLKSPQIFKLSPYRSNLNLRVERVWTPLCRKQKLLKFIKAQKYSSGLVYVRSRRDGETLSEWLQQQGYSTTAYHAGLSGEQRREIEQQWLNNQLPFVICTNAFGMGVNKSNVRWVVHFQPPLLLAEYVQEVGRAGRDGKTAQALTLVCEPTGLLYPDDRQRQTFFLNQLQTQVQTAEKLSAQLPLKGNLLQICQQYPQAEMAIALLQSAGEIIWDDPFHYRRKPNSPQNSWGSQNPWAQIQASQTALSKQMQAYFGVKSCRWQFLLTAFGFSTETNWRCGHCDRCRPH